MKKEVFLAIFVGVTAGLVLAFGVWRLTTNLKKDQNQNQNEVSPTPKPSFSIAISKPSNQDVVTDSKLTIEGLTKKGSVVIASTDSKDYKEVSTQDGSFEIEVDLAGGLNDIIITSLDEQGQSSSTQLRIVYSSEFEKYLGNAPEEEQTSQSTDSADTIRQKIQQKLDSTLKHATSYVGTITDITDTTIQIKSDDNGIQQIMTSEETSFVSDTDMAIGDFIVAMGFVNGNDVLDAKRVLTADTDERNQNKAIWATVLEITGKKVSLTDTVGKNIEIDFPKTWQGPEISELEEKQNIIVVGVLKDNSISLRSIFDIAE